MKILVLEGSPNKKGSTHLLADCFRQGAEEAGHDGTSSADSAQDSVQVTLPSRSKFRHMKASFLASIVA